VTAKAPVAATEMGMEGWSLQRESCDGKLAVTAPVAATALDACDGEEDETRKNWADPW
jgi:hypothetical protein